MSLIEFNEVSIDYSVYDARSTSLRNKLVDISTGGILRPSGQVVTVRALDNVSFTVNPGDAVGLIGHNGAGKTTLLRTMAGVYPPASGFVTVKGDVSTIIEVGAGIEPELTGYVNIIRMGLLSGISRDLLENLIPEIESFSQLGGFLNLPVRTYSTGMVMRLMFAVSTCVERDILLLDEMFSTGDAEFQSRASERMSELINKADIFVFASHSKELIESMCNRFFVLEKGKVLEL